MSLLSLTVAGRYCDQALKIFWWQLLRLLCRRVAVLFLLLFSVCAAELAVSQSSASLVLPQLSATQIATERARRPHLELSAIGRQLAVADHLWHKKTAGNRSVWQLMIRSVGATEVGLVVGNFRLPENCSLTVRDLTGSNSYGLELQMTDRQKRVATPMIPGEVIVIEFHCASLHSLKPANFPFRLDLLSHGLPPVSVRSQQAL